jgi:hypothetical protein
VVQHAECPEEYHSCVSWKRLYRFEAHSLTSFVHFLKYSYRIKNASISEIKARYNNLIAYASATMKNMYNCRMILNILNMLTFVCLVEDKWDFVDFRVKYDFIFLSNSHGYCPNETLFRSSFSHLCAFKQLNRPPVLHACNKIVLKMWNEVQIFEMQVFNVFFHNVDQSTWHFMQPLVMFSRVSVQGKLQFHSSLPLQPPNGNSKMV